MDVSFQSRAQNDPGAGNGSHGSKSCCRTSWTDGRDEGGTCDRDRPRFGNWLNRDCFGRRAWSRGEIRPDKERFTAAGPGRRAGMGDHHRNSDPANRRVLNARRGAPVGPGPADTDPATTNSASGAYRGGSRAFPATPTRFQPGRDRLTCGEAAGSDHLRRPGSAVARRAAACAQSTSCREGPSCCWNSPRHKHSNSSARHGPGAFS